MGIYNFHFASFDTRYRVSDQGAQKVTIIGVSHLPLSESMVYGYDRHMVYLCMGCRSVFYYTATRLCFVMIFMLVSPCLHSQKLVAEPSDNRGKIHFHYSIVYAYISLLMLYFSRCLTSHFRFLGQT